MDSVVVEQGDLSYSLSVPFRPVELFVPPFSLEKTLEILRTATLNRAQNPSDGLPHG